MNRSSSSTKKPKRVVLMMRPANSLADPVDHELDLLPLDQFALGFGGAALGFRASLGDGVQAFGRRAWRLAVE